MAKEIQTNVVISINIPDPELQTEKIYNALLQKFFSADSPLMIEIAEYLLEVINERFEQQGYEEPDDWERPSDWTMLRRIVEGRYPNPGDELNREHWKSLIDTGALRESFEYVIEDFRIIVGTNLNYARLQQEGGESLFPAFVSLLINQKLPGSDPFYKRFVDPGSQKSESIWEHRREFEAVSIDVHARPMVGFTEENIEEIKKIIINYMTRR